MARVCDISELKKRADDLQQWIEKNAPECFAEQKQLDEGTRERAYWHYGYMVAMRDVLRFLTGTDTPNRKQYSADNSNSIPSV